MLARLGRSAIGGARLQPQRLAAVPSRAFSNEYRISTDFVPQEDTWQAEGTHHVKKKLDIWDTLSMAVGPRPDTVTSDNLRSSRTESQTRVFNPATPVDSAGNPVIAEVPQNTGVNTTAADAYDVRPRPRPLRCISQGTTASADMSTKGIVDVLFCCRRASSTTNTSRGIRA